MFHSTESDCASYSPMHLVEQALKTLKQNVAIHFEQKTRLERLHLGWQQTWLSQCDQLRIRIDGLEARLSPWMTLRDEGPRLAVLSHQEEAV